MRHGMHQEENIVLIVQRVSWHNKFGWPVKHDTSVGPAAMHLTIKWLWQFDWPGHSQTCVGPVIDQTMIIAAGAELAVSKNTCKPWTGDWHTISQMQLHSLVSIIGYWMNMRLTNSISKTIREAKCIAIGVQSDNIAGVMEQPLMPLTSHIYTYRWW